MHACVALAWYTLQYCEHVGYCVLAFTDVCGSMQPEISIYIVFSNVFMLFKGTYLQLRAFLAPVIAHARLPTTI